jgi:hemerythrin superfamily protein
VSKATEVIEAEHREIERLFDRYPKAPDMSAAQHLCRVLERHTEMEEAILYPELQRVDGDLYADAVEEHAEAKRLVEQIRASSIPEDIAALIAQLQREVSHHVADEEQEDLPRMESVLGEARMDELGAELQRWKDAQTD